MLKLKKIAITGGVASGKTAACQFFHELGAFVVNADAIVHELLNPESDPESDLRQQVIRQFGPEILADGKISRKKIAEKAFKDPQQLAKLEKLLHPAVLQKIEALYKQACRSEAYTSFVVEIPLLFEIQGEPFYDCVVAVLADEAIARQRFERAGYPPEEYDRRMKRQLSPQQKAERAHYQIQNNGSLDDLKNQVIALNKILKLKAKHA
jgi:dephospho-CoA kinase